MMRARNTSQRERGASRSPWRPPTRRAFLAMLGAAAAALAVRSETAQLTGHVLEDDRPRRTWTGTTRWIGHC